MIINNIPFNADLEDILIELKAQLSLNGIELLSTIKNTPDNLMVSCVYHKGGQEKRPSMGIRKSDGLCHCFACGETQSLQQMVSHCFGHYDDLVGAFGWNWLLKNFVSINVEERKDIELDFSRDKKQPTKIEYVSEEELDSYRYIHPYMYKRKLTDGVIEVFDIGYDKNTQCITFPIRDVNGNCLFIARRSVNTKFFNYPNGVEKPVYGLYELSKISIEPTKIIQDTPKAKIMEIKGYPNEIIICESMLDALACWSFGKYAVALNGLGTDAQMQALNKLPCRKFILATDMDSAGLNARAKIKRKLKNKLVSEYRWDINVAKDINDMTKEYFDSLEEIF